MITRKEFIKISSLTLGGLFFPVKSFAENLFLLKPGFGNLRMGTGIFTERGGTIGWYISNDAVIAIDTQFPDTAETFRKGIENKAKRNFDFVFNTHHHGDHTSGNFLLRKYTDKIVAHENCPKLQKQAYGNGENADKQVYADTTFTEVWKKDIGTDSLSAVYLGPAHTGGDSIIYFEKADVAHVGDLVFNRTYPYIDTNGGGSIKGWIEVLEKTDKHFPSSTAFIFGHAASDEQVTGKKEDIVYMKNYLTALAEHVEKSISAGNSKDEVASTKVPGFDLFERRAGALKQNLEAAYVEFKK